MPAGVPLANPPGESYGNIDFSPLSGYGSSGRPAGADQEELVTDVLLTPSIRRTGRHSAERQALHTHPQVSSRDVSSAELPARSNAFDGSEGELLEEDFPDEAGEVGVVHPLPSAASPPLAVASSSSENKQPRDWPLCLISWKSLATSVDRHARPFEAAHWETV